MTQKRKLIEVALPLEAINRESAREKSIRHGHPSTLHLWWARRPLAAARAVLFAQLVDDPSSHPDRFPTEDAQKAERVRLHKIIEELVVWENVRDERVLNRARAEILASTDGNPPPILDPFAGGGTIPLEAQRLGLEAHASDLNPVAVLINKALIEIPPKFRDRPPVFPGLAGTSAVWAGAEGLAADVRAYGQWMRDEAEKRIGHLYPKADGKHVIAWIWARTVTCPNPACEAEVPLVSSLDLSTKKDRQSWLRPTVSNGRVDFHIAAGERSAESNKRGQGARFECWVCGSAVTPEQVHAQLDVEAKPAARLLAIVAEGPRRRDYLEPTTEHLIAAERAMEAAQAIRMGDDFLGAGSRGTFGGNAQGRRYGFFTFADYFTDRQAVALTTFSDLVGEARERVLVDALASGLAEGERLDAGGAEAAAYADAVAVYLGLAVSRLTSTNSSVCRWNSAPSKESVSDTFARQAISMVWDFAEGNVFNRGPCELTWSADWVARSLERTPCGVGRAAQADAIRADVVGYLISTDPPYYDNIGYSDLSDFFYVWQRRSLGGILPELFGTLLVPKSEELVASRYRHGGKDRAKQFFEDGFREVFRHAREAALDDYPITVYYAFKQSEAGDDGDASSGWETLLEGMIRSGWAITATWPLRSERSGRMISIGTNALASSIVLALRPRPADAPSTDRPGFISALKAELVDALETLQVGGIAPVDLPQAAIGPGMAVFSRYSAVREFDGSQMSVRAALARINEVLDEVLSEQEGDFDPTTRFCLAWYRQHGYGDGKYGDAELLGNARGIAVSALHRDEVLHSAAGRVRLLRPTDLATDYDVIADDHTSTWEVLHHLIRILDSEGVVGAGRLLAAATSRDDRAVDRDLMTELAHLLFRISEDNRWAKEALAFNGLVTAWGDIVESSRGTTESAPEQGALNFE